MRASVCVCLCVLCACLIVCTDIKREKNSHSHRINIILPPQWYSNSDSNSNSNLSLLTLNNIPFTFRYSINRSNKQANETVWTCCFSHGNTNNHCSNANAIQHDPRLSKLTDRPTLDEAIKFHSAPTKTLEIPCIFTVHVWLATMTPFIFQTSKFECHIIMFIETTFSKYKCHFLFI